MTDDTFRKIILFLNGSIGLCILILGFVIFTTIQTKLHTEVVKISTSSNEAILSVRSLASENSVIGTKTATIRLTPGGYVLSANGGGLQTIKMITVIKGKPLDITLNPTNDTPQNSTSSVSYNNFDRLAYYGLLDNQLETVKKIFILYIPSAKTISISHDSITQDPIYNDTLWYTLNFTVSVDSTLYKANLVYDGESATKLTLYDASSGAQVFPDMTNE